jgi:hypothetical protein
MLPASFLKDGFLPPEKLNGKRKHLLIGSDGWSNTGKTEFACSAPGPGIVLCLDRGHEAMLDNPNPPKTRRDDFAFKVINLPIATQGKPDYFLQYWKEFYDWYKKALDNPDVRTVVLDSDSDSWDLQRLADFGRLTQIPAIMYTQVNANRRAMIARAFDSGKIVIGTNRLKEGYTSKLDKDNREVRVKTGSDERQGFADQDYLWQIQIRHLYDNGRFGLKIIKCKADTTVQGLELWDGDCCFQSLVQTVYPNVPLSQWGY